MNNFKIGTKPGYTDLMSIAGEAKSAGMIYFTEGSRLKATNKKVAQRRHML